jgi:hypothetical protein
VSSIRQQPDDPFQDRYEFRELSPVIQYSRDAIALQIVTLRGLRKNQQSSWRLRIRENISHWLRAIISA